MCILYKMCAKRRLIAQSDQSSLGVSRIIKNPRPLQMDSEATDQADLSHYWAYLSEGTFPHLVAHVGKHEQMIKVEHLL